MFKLNQGETPISDAPLTDLGNGARVYPQHFLSYNHTLSSIEKIIIDCELDEKTLIFSGKDEYGLYIQIGLIGFDTYEKRTSSTERKIVYGRRWRVETFLSTSELLQTTLLALKKAREHEVRELLKISCNGVYSAPFSSHQDNLLLTSMAESIKAPSPVDDFRKCRKEIMDVLRVLRFDNSEFQALEIERRNSGEIIIDLQIEASNFSTILEKGRHKITLILSSCSVNNFLFSLMEALIIKSDRYVDQAFRYKGVNRFSQDFSITKIAEISIITRQIETKSGPTFQKNLAIHNREIDELRTPSTTSPILAGLVEKKLAKFHHLNGVKPKLNAR